MIRFVDQVNNQVNFASENLPLLIAGKESSGASFFSISLVSYFFYLGKRIIFYGSRDLGREEFINQTKINPSDLIVINESLDILNISNQRVIFVKSGDNELFGELLSRISDLKDRVVFIKNIEESINEEIISAIKDCQKIILTGDLDRVQKELSKKICRIGYDTKIFFSNVESLDLMIPQIPRYQGVLVRDKQRSRIVKVVVN